MVEDGKKRFIRELLVYLAKQKRVSRRLGKTSKSLLNLNQGRENAFHDVAQYVRAVTKPRRKNG